MANEWQGPAQKVGSQAIKHLLNYWQNPSLYSNAAAGAAESAGGLGLSNLGGVGFDSIAPFLPVLGVALQGYNAYTGGSHRNEPLEKRAKTQGIGRLISDLLSGKKIDWDQSARDNTYGGAGTTYLPSSITGVTPGEGVQTIDPRGPKINDLYNQMIEMSSSRYQNQGLGNSGWSGSDINSLFGQNRQKLAQAMNLPDLPDWSQYDKGSGFTPEYLQNDPTGKALQSQVGKNPYDDQWNALDEKTRNDYEMIPSGDYGAGNGRQIWEDEQTIKQLNDQYNLGLETREQRQARLSKSI